MASEIIRTPAYLHSEVAARGLVGLAALSKDIPGIMMFETWRSPERQDELYAIGRPQTIPVRPWETWPIRTKAKAWESWHQYGLAFDVAVHVPAYPDAGIEAHWSWDFDRDKVREMLINVHQLEPGPSFESGHFQLTLGMTIEEAHALTQKSGIFAVWEHLSTLLKK